MHKDSQQGRDWNEGHPDHEGEMAVSQLHRLADMANMLLEMIGENDDLPGWVQYKISRSYSDLTDVFGYIESKYDAGVQGTIPDQQQRISLEKDASMAEGKKKKGLWANIHARRKAGKRPLKPGEKGYPKTLKIDETMLRAMIQKIIKNQ